MTELAGTPGRPIPGRPDSAPVETAQFDPLRLCIFTTVALLTWIFGPLAVLWFAGMGLVGYWRAHQAGLTRSKCYLQDVRLVLLYLGAIAAVAAYAIVKYAAAWLA